MLPASLVGRVRVAADDVDGRLTAGRA